MHGANIPLIVLLTCHPLLDATAHWLRSAHLNSAPLVPTVSDANNNTRHQSKLFISTLCAIAQLTAFNLIAFFSCPHAGRSFLSPLHALPKRRVTRFAPLQVGMSELLRPVSTASQHPLLPLSGLMGSQPYPDYALARRADPAAAPAGPVGHLSSSSSISSNSSGSATADRIPGDDDGGAPTDTAGAGADGHSNKGLLSVTIEVRFTMYLWPLFCSFAAACACPYPPPARLARRPQIDSDRFHMQCLPGDTVASLMRAVCERWELRYPKSAIAIQAMTLVGPRRLPLHRIGVPPAAVPRDPRSAVPAPGTSARPGTTPALVPAAAPTPAPAPAFAAPPPRAPVLHPDDILFHVRMPRLPSLSASRLALSALR
jgi:hypothetical protein